MKSSGRLIVGMVVAIFACFFFCKVLIKNPTDTTSKFMMMKADMEYTLGAGGEVVFMKDLDRGSVASLMRSISAKSWSDDLFNKYQHSLLARGWKNVPANGGYWQACKLGALVTLDKKPSFFPALGENIYGMRFEYSAGSKDQCDK
jgi:hypothetical protein